jgi:hypothetical protein
MTSEADSERALESTQQGASASEERTEAQRLGGRGINRARGGER